MSISIYIYLYLSPTRCHSNAGITVKSDVNHSIHCLDIAGKLSWLVVDLPL